MDRNNFNNILYYFSLFNIIYYIYVLNNHKNNTMISIKPLANLAESLYYLELYVNEYKTIPGKKRALTRTIKDIQEQIEYLEPKINGPRPCWYLGERWFNSDLLRLKAELDQAINYRNNLNNTK